MQNLKVYIQVYIVRARDFKIDLICSKEWQHMHDADVGVKL